MSRFGPLIFAVFVFSAFAGINVLLLKYLHPDWWKKRAIRYPALLSMPVGVFFVGIWMIGVYAGMAGLSRFGQQALMSVFLLLLATLVSLPFSGIVHIGTRLFAFLKFKMRKTDTGVSAGRRRFLRNAAAVFPAVALTSSVAGLSDSFSKIRVPVRRIPIANLPDTLVGFKIAHLSDSHLGIYVGLSELEQAVEIIKLQQPDLALVTGDIADHLDILSDAIEIISSLEPPHGIYASVGNHEYYRGIKRVRQIFETAPFPLLINENRLIEIGSTTVAIGGADDPRLMRGDSSQFLHDAIEATMGSMPSQSFKILMSHRPPGFNHAANMGIDLVLAGHTHGGQLGLFGRSLFEGVIPDTYLWGIYRRGRTTLHTSGGMGHWLPFRLGCPAEAPILILEKG
jgi:predicted MPP superfamily phosphohydrolase